jgi:5-methylcytosine-specific restriction endonuclease McrA
MKKTRYGLTPEQHKAMYLAQNGCCAICGEPAAYGDIHTDHDHNTGRVRGLLCRRCNTQIAIFDNYELLDKAIQYLERVR